MELHAEAEKDADIEDNEEPIVRTPQTAFPGEFSRNKNLEPEQGLPLEVGFSFELLRRGGRGEMAKERAAEVEAQTISISMQGINEACDSIQISKRSNSVDAHLHECA